MDVYRKAPKATNATPTVNPAADPGNGMNVSVAPLVTMIAVLVIILIFCFCGAPAVRQFCRKRVCYCCPEPESDEPAARREEDEFVVLTNLHGSKKGEGPPSRTLQQHQQ